MIFDVETVVEPERMRVTMRGSFSVAGMFEFIDRVRAEADNAERTKVLIDCTEMEGGMTEVDRFEGGQYIAQVFGSRIHAAVVMPEGQVTKLGEMAAVNRGAVFFVTESMPEAEAWLHSSR